MRPSKREIQREVKDLEGRTEEPEPVFVLETEAGEYMTPDGEPVEDPTVACFTMPPSVWEEWVHL